MRIYLNLTPNTEIVPFNYQRTLVGAFHKWLGENELHNDISLYSLSWLENGHMRRDKKGLDFPHGARLAISSPMESLHKSAIDGIFKNQNIRWGMKVKEVILRPTPEFGTRHIFRTASPILIKRNRPEAKGQQFFYHSDSEAAQYMTETLQAKLIRMDIDSKVNVQFDKTYPNPKIKMIHYNGIDIKATHCPVIIEGDPKSLQFAWEVGIGNSTGIGFGALK